jgi:alpha/beta superfamily hydrolase
MAKPPKIRTGLGPKRSAAMPLIIPPVKKMNVVIENKAEVALLLVPNSEDMGSKNAPKLYTTPKQINIETKAHPTATHPFEESSSPIGSSIREFFVPVIESP